MKLTKMLVPAVVIGLGAPALAQLEPLDVVSYSARYNASTSTVDFDILFTRYPDFINIDPDSGSVVDAFQMYLDTQPGNNGWGGTAEDPWETIIRGSEIHYNNDIRIRDHTGPMCHEPGCGTWGPLAGSVPYTLDEEGRLTFSAPFSMLNTTTGRFSYELDTVTYGSFVAAYFGDSAAAGCRVDVNGDGAVNVQDFLAFLSLYAAGDAQADFTGDGAINVQDFLAFLSAYAAGC
jgi:hypothetical protein